MFDCHALKGRFLAVNIFALSLLNSSQIQSAYAEVAVIVHPSANISETSEANITNIFLGKSNQLSEGLKVTPIDQEEGEEPRDEFYTKLVKKDASQLNAYWSRLIFTGKGQPPRAVLDDDEVLEFVGANPNAIGYVSASSVDDSVKMIYLIK